MLFIHQGASDSIRNCADTKLNRGAVWDFFCNQISDGRACVVHFSTLHNWNGIVAFIKCCDFRNVDFWCTTGTRKVMVDFQKDMRRFFLQNFSQRAIAGREISVFIHRTYPGTPKIDLFVLVNQFRYFMIIAGSDVTISLCDSLACRHAGKPGNSMNRRGAGFLITFVGIDI